MVEEEPETQSTAEEEEEEELDEDDEESSLPDLSVSMSKPNHKPKSQRRRSGPFGVDSEEEEQEEPEEKIPSALLTVLLQSHFVNKGQGNGRGKVGATRMSKEATAAAGKYIDTFVREAIARAAFGDGRGDGGGGGNEGVLEVESLEKLCPQLLLDF